MSHFADVRLAGVLSDNSCRLEIQTNHGFTMMYRFQENGNGHARYRAVSTRIGPCGAHLLDTQIVKPG